MGEEKKGTRTRSSRRRTCGPAAFLGSMSERPCGSELGFEKRKERNDLSFLLGS